MTRLHAFASVLVLGSSSLLVGCARQEADSAASAVDVKEQAAYGSGSTDVGHYYNLKSVSTGFCVDVSGKALTDGASAIQYTCSTGENQRWYFRALSSSTYQLQAEHSAKCLRVSGGSLSSGAKMVQDPCARTGTGLTGSVWTATKVGTASPAQYQLKETTTGKCLQSPSTTKGAQLIQGTCGTSTKFLWTFAQVASVAQSDTNGRWSPVIDLKGVVPVAASLLPNGKVLAWASWSGTRFGGGSISLDQTVTALFDPSNTGNVVVSTITNTAHNMFCPGTALLADGRVLVNGGDDTRTDATSLYDPATDTWSTGGRMTQPRWYNVSVTLPDGRALTLGGNRTSGLSGNGEIYDPATNLWTAMDGIALAPLVAGTDDVNRAMEHPRLFVAPDGRIFVPGPTPNMQFYSLDGQGSVTSAGVRGDDEFSQNDVTVMYDVGKFLKAGGNINYDRTNALYTPSSRNSYLIDITSGQAVVTKIAPMKYPRDFANGVVLPDGKVFVTGGADHGKGFSDDGGVRAAEMFDPVTATWRELPPNARTRPYHSIALLLPDARVLVGGGGLCSTDTCTVNHADVEIYSPPYLFAGTRPVIASAPRQVTADGATFPVLVTGNATSFALIRMASVTHTVDTDQRYMQLSATGAAGAWTVTAPANHNVAPPGYYLLFALDGGVPSVASVVQIL